jgi:hypothetical protein
VHLVGFIIRIYHDARSHERKKHITENYSKAFEKNREGLVTGYKFKIKTATESCKRESALRRVNSFKYRNW